MDNLNNVTHTSVFPDSEEPFKWNLNAITPSSDAREAG